MFLFLKRAEGAIPSPKRHNVRTRQGSTLCSCSYPASPSLALSEHTRDGLLGHRQVPQLSWLGWTWKQRTISIQLHGVRGIVREREQKTTHSKVIGCADVLKRNSVRIQCCSILCAMYCCSATSMHLKWLLALPQHSCERATES
jgi:hypothetical protein